MKHRIIIAVGAVALVAATAAADTATLTGTPWVYDPGNLGNSSSVWETAGGQWVLDLQKNAPTGSDQAAGATVTGMDGQTLTEVGFDVRGYCGAGAPRVNMGGADPSRGRRSARPGPLRDAPEREP